MQGLISLYLCEKQVPLDFPYSQYYTVLWNYPCDKLFENCHKYVIPVIFTVDWRLHGRKSTAVQITRECMRRLLAAHITKWRN